MPSDMIEMGVPLTAGAGGRPWQAAARVDRQGTQGGSPGGSPGGGHTGPQPHSQPQSRPQPKAARPGPRRDAPAPLQGGDLRHIVLIAALLLGLAVAGATALLISHLRDRAVDDRRHELKTLALVLADQADRAFEAVELLQTGLIEKLRNAGMQTPDDFRRLMTGWAVHEDLRSRVRSLPQLDAITAIDTEGRLLNFSRYWPIPAVNVADRDYFKALKADPALPVFISQPVPNRGTGTWTIYIARKVSNAEGEFLGLILGAVELAYFERLYASVARGPDSAVGLLRQDATMLARHPHVETSIGTSFAGAAIFRRLAETGAPDAVVVQPSQIEGRPRLVAAHRSARFPLIVTASATLDSILADWRTQVTAFVIAAAFIELVIAGLALLLLRQIRSQALLADARAAEATADAARRHAEAELERTQERARAERAYNLQNLRFGAALANMSQALAMFDGENRLVVANARLARQFDLPPAAIEPGTSFAALLEAARHSAGLAAEDIAFIGRSVRRLTSRRVAASHVREIADGRSLAICFQPMAENGWLVTIEDITERRQAEARIAHMAHHDALTGLPNRVLFHKRLNQAIARSRRGEPCAVLCLDLDHFKAVNDTLGHPVGDALLRAVTERLLKQVRETDTVARLGGDEFAIVQSSVDQPRDSGILATRLIEALTAPYDLDGHQVIIGTSIGIAVVPHDGDDPHELMKNADLALYRAKEDGRGRYRCFEPAMDAEMQARRSLELDLRRALLLGEFEIFYQPLMTLQPRGISGFEALLRWHHPERGLLGPDEFIPLAEEIGLIVPLGEWVLRRACADAMTWPSELKVAVNLSAVQFGHRHLVQEVRDALGASGLPAHRLELEITETAMLDDAEKTMALLHQLRALGVGITLDDFGTGYSSLSYLRRFSFDRVKIDRSFIDELGKGGDCDAIVGAVTDLCKRMGVATTAEGVETEDQLTMLGELYCTEVQGFLFSRPRPADEVPRIYALLREAEPVA